MVASPFLKKKTFIPLHAHTTKGSIGDSILKIDKYIKRAKEYGLTHLAITDHGSLSAMYDFYDQCSKENIQAIIGCEVYVARDRLAKDKDNAHYNHLVLIAKNEIGMQNLLYITTDAQLNGFYYKPRTDISVLQEHGEGIIALSGCIAGKIPELILQFQGNEYSQEETDEKVEQIKTEIETFKNIFDEFYLEIQPGSFPDQVFVNEMLVYLADETDTQLVITNDIHYLDSDDWFAHDIHVKIAQKKKFDEPQIYPDNCYYFQNYTSIKNSFSYLQQNTVEIAINNTNKIAQSCTLQLNNKALYMPKFTVPKGYDENSWLVKITLQKLEEIQNVLSDPANYASRAKYELDVIQELGFSGYFLTVRDFVEHAKQNNIPVGPGRGSVCGSIVAFLCGITEVDAIKYNLLFERFLSAHRKGSIPDVDLDFSADKRQLMFDYAVAKHGASHCALVSTLGMRKARASLRDTARVFNIPDELADEAAKLIPQVYYDEDGEKTTDLSIEDSIKIVPRLREIAEENPDWFDMAITLEDLPRAGSIHAAGTLVSPVELMKYIPLIKPNTEGINATALNLSDAEKAGFVKYDFLSLATLAVIDQTEKDVGYYFDIANDKYDDEAVWDLIGSKNTTCLFQIASKTYKDRMFRLRPHSIKELAACLALVRGPCISSKADQVYMEIIEGKREVELIHPFYDRATSETNGILLYQEQVMNIAVNFGFSLEDGFKLMKAVSKKKIEKILEYETEFRRLADERNVPIEVQDKVWKIIVDAGLYCFNESHAVAYALVCYESAYLKYYYPLYYMKNALTNAYLRKEEIEETVQECRRLGIKFAPLDLNESLYEFSIIDESTLRVGMCAIKSFGEAAAEEIITKRPFVDVEDFLERIEKAKCTKRAIIPGIFSGLFSCFDEDRRAIYEVFCDLRKEEVSEEIKLQGGQAFNINDSYDTIEELLLGVAIISNPVNNLASIGFDKLKNNSKFTIEAVIKRIKKFKDKAGNDMAFLTLETADGYIDCTLFADVYKKYKSLCKKNMQCKVSGKKDKESSCIGFRIE
jgi:DNA polymerase-3 subunit alpha